jgi:hypothetical protein
VFELIGTQASLYLDEWMIGSNDEKHSQVVGRFSRLLDGDCRDLCFASARAEQ